MTPCKMMLNMHQLSARIENRVSRMKNKGQQAYMHSKIEVIQNCAEVKDKIEASQVAAKRVIKNRNPEICALTRAKRAKLERDKGRAETLASFEVHNHSKIKKLHDGKKDELLLLLNYG